MTPYQQCRYLRRLILLRAAEVMTYTQWSDDYAAQRIRNIRTNIKGIDVIDISKLTVDEMKDLGFTLWDDVSNIYLIPLWLFQFLPDGINYHCIDGTVITEVSKMDNDHRGGCLSYGIKV